MAILLTGAAGFIGYHVATALLQRGDTVIGVDNLDPYYSVRIKEERLRGLRNFENFQFLELDIADAESLKAATSVIQFDRIIHLAAQAGVRYSIENPQAYVRSNLIGHANILELARRHKGSMRLVYASSSSVYGGRTDPPFRETDRVDKPVSFYAATKVANEALSHSYAELYGLPQIGLRFFTVYGPWGRPDMAYWTFAEALLKKRPLRVFADGQLRRDFTWIGDIVDGVVAAIDKEPLAAKVPHRIYNLGGSQTYSVLEMIAIMERAAGLPAQIEYSPMQPGDVPLTSADVSRATQDLGYLPKTPLTIGLPRFVEWYSEYRSRHG